MISLFLLRMTHPCGSLLNPLVPIEMCFCSVLFLLSYLTPLYGLNTWTWIRAKLEAFFTLWKTARIVECILNARLTLLAAKFHAGLHSRPHGREEAKEAAKGNRSSSSSTLRILTQTFNCSIVIHQSWTWKKWCSIQGLPAGLGPELEVFSVPFERHYSLTANSSKRQCSK